MEFAEFIGTLSDMELVAMQRKARQVSDNKTLNLVLVELGDRQCANERLDMTADDTTRIERIQS